MDHMSEDFSVGPNAGNDWPKDPKIGNTAWDGASEYVWLGPNSGWSATGKHKPGFTNTPHRGEPLGSRDRKPRDAEEELRAMADGDKPKPTINDVLNQRETTHGNFGDNARISQATKSLWRSEPGWNMLDDDMKEVLEMEALKIGRILSGNPNEPDHWLDNSGYPAMIANRLKFGTHKV